MVFRTILVGVLFALTWSGQAHSQSPSPQPVEWKAALSPDAPLRAGGHATIDVSGKVDPGWHVYALTQRAGGPIPLRISLDENAIAEIHGKVTGAEPIKQQHAGFQMETQLYKGDFLLHLPIDVKQVATGPQSLPISVRFQACNDRVCLPPRTIHLTVAAQAISGR